MPIPSVRPRLSRRLALLCTAMTAAPAFADPVARSVTSPVPTPAGDPVEDPQRGEDILVQGRRVVGDDHAPARGSLDATQPQSVVSERFVEDIVPPGGDYSQTIKFTPSFSFSSPNGPGGAESKSQVLRGFADGQYNVTIDGVPFGDTNDFTHHTTSFFPSGVLGQVTVDRGPGRASTIGYATFGGTVALNSRALADTAGGFVRGGYGSFNDRLATVEAQSGAVAATGGTRVLVDYLHHETDGALDYAHLRTRQLVAKLAQPLGGGWTLDAFASINRTIYNNWSQITPNQLALYGKTFGALNDDPRTVLYRGYNYKTKVSDVEYLAIAGTIGTLEVQDKGYSVQYRNAERNGNDATDLGLPPTKTSASYGSPAGPAGNLDVIGNRQGNQYRAWGNILTLGRRIRAGAASGTLRAGLWFEHEDNYRYQYLVDFTRGGAFAVAPGADPYGFNGTNANGAKGTGAYVYNVNARVDTWQPYAEYEWTPIDAVTVVAGVKHISFKRTHDAAINLGSKLPLQYERTWNATLPSLNVNWKIDGRNTLYGQVARGFLAPNVNVFATASIAKNNFTPQTTTNYQAGIVHQDGRVSFDGDLYYIDFNNFITAATDFTVTPNQTYAINGGGVIYKGIEAQASFAVTRAVSVFAAASLNSAKTKGNDRLAGGGLWVAGAPDHTLSLGALYDDGGLYGSLLAKRVGARYFGANRVNLNVVDGQKVPTAAAEIADPVTGASWRSNRLGAYTTADLTLGYRFPLGEDAVVRAVKLELQVQNLFDDRRATDTNGRLGTGDAINPATTTYLYLPPRSVFGTVTVGF